MLRTCAGLFAGMLMATTSSGALAQSLGWRVSEASGQVTVRHGAETRPAKRGETLAQGDSVQTGANGRAVLVHSRDFVTVAANSRVSVPGAEQATGLTRLIQSVGNAIFRIEKLGRPHFGVSTPYLAAVVKGTTFSVTVDGTGTSLQVTEGAVEVETLDGGARDLIRPGAVAMIAAADLYRLQVQGDQNRTIDSPARPVTSSAVTPSLGATPANLPATMPTMVVAFSAPAPVGGSAAESVTNDATESPFIGEAISSKPIDLGAATGGLLTGKATSEVAAVAQIVDQVAIVAAAKVGSSPPSDGSAPVPDTAVSTPPPSIEGAPAPDTSVVPTPGGGGASAPDMGVVTPPDGSAAEVPGAAIPTPTGPTETADSVVGRDDVDPTGDPPPPTTPVTETPSPVSDDAPKEADDAKDAADEGGAKAEKDKAEKDKADKEKAEKDTAEKEKAGKDKGKDQDDDDDDDDDGRGGKNKGKGGDDDDDRGDDDDDKKGGKNKGKSGDDDDDHDKDEDYDDDDDDRKGGKNKGKGDDDDRDEDDDDDD